MELRHVIRTLALLVTSSLLVVSAATSNKGFIEKGSKLYKVLSYRAGSHATAAALCAQHNAMLPEPKTEIENQNLATLDSEMFYIGMTDSAEEGKWVWDSDGSDVTWFEWIEWKEPGWGGANPNGGTRENCAVMLKDHGKGGEGHRHEGWVDKPCDKFPVHVVCQRKVPTVCSPGKYGVNCTHTCNKGCKGGVCDKVTAHCLQGCRDGYHGDKCVEDCPYGFIRHGDNCYLFVNQKKNWHEAQNYCKAKKAKLAEPQTNGDNTFVRNLVKQRNGGSIWLGATNKAREGLWTWDSSHDQVLFTDWAADQPNDYASSQDCLELREEFGYKWNDFYCHDMNSFVCQKPAN